MLQIIFNFWHSSQVRIVLFLTVIKLPLGNVLNIVLSLLLFDFSYDSFFSVAGESCVIVGSFLNLAFCKYGLV